MPTSPRSEAATSFSCRCVSITLVSVATVDSRRAAKPAISSA